MSLARTVVLKAAALRPVESLVRKSFLFRPLVTRFVAGDELAEAIVASEKILAAGQRITLDLLGENTHSPAEAEAAVATYIRMLESIDASPTVQKWRNSPKGREPLNISIKLTQCGLDLGDEVAEKNYRRVLTRAAELDNFVRIDMEASAYTARTIEIVARVHEEFPNTGTVLQSYLYRTDEDVELVISRGLRTRLVKGAYLEPDEVAEPEKAKVDAAYVRQAKRLLEAGNYPAIATQDERIIRELNAFVKERGIDQSTFEYQFLYGIRRELQQELTRDGYNVRVYVPFGDAWYPYFTRRLAERPANAFFIAKSLFQK
ncbi:proline dehydrogenase [bacterium]|nr:MAG: proline dehydrogenase [bacterium]